MSFRPEAADEFLRLFDESARRIRAFDGCHHLELLQDADDPSVFTTYSLWSDAEALDRYRASPLFRSTWAVAKELFAAPPTASSHFRMREL